MNDIQKLYEIAKSTNNDELLKYIAEQNPVEYKKLQKASGSSGKRGRPKKTIVVNDEPKQATPSRILDISKFKLNKDKSSTARQPLSRGTPVKWRGNQWSDDGVSDKGIENITPKVKPVPRTRPKYQPVSIVCSKCNEQVMIDSTHIRDNFICDSCIEQRVKRASRS